MTKLITNRDRLTKLISTYKKKGKKISLAHGVFDVVHIGHIEYFKEAKKLSDILIVSITADKFVNKGLNRPFFKEKDTEFQNATYCLWHDVAYGDKYVDY